MIVQVCVGSACHIKGSADIVELLQKSVEEHNLETEITLAGCFCTGECNHIGVTVQIDDKVHTGVTKEGFKEFFELNILKPLKGEGM